MKSVVLGGSGFIGAHLTRALVQAGQQVVVYDRYAPALAPQWPGAHYVTGDYTDPTDPGLAQALAGADTLYHLAWHLLPAASNSHLAADIEANLIGALHLLTHCVQAGVGRVIFFSSGGTIYGPAQALPISETHPTEPRTSHAINKLAVEKYLALFHQLYGLDYVILRPGNPFGPYQDPRRGQGVIAAFLAQAAAGEPLALLGDGSVVRDYFYVSDLVRAARLAAATPHSRTVYNIASGVGRSLNDVIAAIGRVVGRELIVRSLPGRAADVSANILDISRARDWLGWEPQVTFEDGLRRTWAALNASAASPADSWRMPRDPG